MKYLLAEVLNAIAPPDFSVFRDPYLCRKCGRHHRDGSGRFLKHLDFMGPFRPLPVNGTEKISIRRWINS